MHRYRVVLLLITLLLIVANSAAAQQRRNRTVEPQAATAANPVIGSGTTGRLSKWTGQDGSNTFVLGNANVFEDKFGKIGVGTPTPTSPLTVQGMIETTLGGYKFPDGTVQTTAGIAFVTHDASLSGLGTPGSPLGIALSGVQTVHLANGAVTAPKIANGTVVRSLNNLFDNVAIVGGTNITVTPSGNTLTIAAPNAITSVAHGSTLTGNGTSGSPLDVANSGIGNAQLADNAVTASKIANGAIGIAQLADNAVTASKVANGAIGTAQLADNAVSSSKVANGAIGNAQLADNAVTFSKVASGQVVTSLNNLTDSVTLAAGSNISITPSGNTLTIATAGGSSEVYQASQDGPYDNLNNPGFDVISKEVPAGSYLIFAKVPLYATDSDVQEVVCTLSTGDSSGVRTVGGNQQILVLQDIATFATTTTIKVHCSGFKFVVGFPTHSRTVLTALKIN